MSSLGEIELIPRDDFRENARAGRSRGASRKVPGRKPSSHRLAKLRGPAEEHESRDRGRPRPADAPSHQAAEPIANHKARAIAARAAATLSENAPQPG